MPRQREFKTNALGSGVIVDSKNGYILTNNHVVDDMDGIRVKLIDKREFDATIIGTDPKSDLAVLKIDAENLDDIDIDRTIEAAIWGGFTNSGQTCISVERIIVNEIIYNLFLVRTST